MSKSNDTQISDNTNQSSHSGIEEITMQMMQIVGGGQNQPSSEQIDRFLDLQEKGMDYTHKRQSHVFTQRYP